MIHYRNEVAQAEIDARALKRTAMRLLVATGCADASLSILLTDDARIRTVNREHRGKDTATDVLSFPIGASETPGVSGPERLLGDVVISVDAARRQAADYGATLQNEINRLLIHGLLHILGHDHELPLERAVMQGEERRLAAAIGMLWPYD